MVHKKSNIFNKPEYYRKIILEQDNILKYDINKHNWKSLICVFFTAFCGVGCPFCFFHSPNYKKSHKLLDELENHFTADAVEKFINFANSSNVWYLQISGGGEPFLEKDAIVSCIEKVNADRIILVTSWSRAYDKRFAIKYLNDIYKASLKRDKPARITIRLSVSEHHNIKLHWKPVINLLDIFEKAYKDNKNFTLQLKTFEGDNALVNILNTHFKWYNLSQEAINWSDDNDHIKVIPRKYKLTLKSWYWVIVWKSRIFYSTQRPDINRFNSIKKNIEVYDTDLFLSQKNNSSIIYNSDNKIWLDWIVEYNWNVCTRQNRIQDNLLNIYEDDYMTVLKKTYSDPLTYSYIDKWWIYRINIVNEISEKAVRLMKSVNIRDYAGTLLFFDEKIRLYYTIRVIQDYLNEWKINKKYLDRLPIELKESIYMEKSQLKKMYNESDYSIFEQILQNPVCENEFYDFLELIKLWHYDISDKKVKQAIDYYNLLFNKNLWSINDVSHQNGLEVERRLTKRMMIRKNIKEEQYEKYLYLYRHGETNRNIENKIKWQLESIDTFFTPRWLTQIEKIHNNIKMNNIEAIFSSDLERARDTATIINNNLNLQLYYTKDFRWLNMGNFQWKKMDKVLLNKSIKKAFLDYNVKIPWWESINELLERFIDWIKKLYYNYNYDKMAIISHGAAISNIKSYIAKSKYEDIDYCVIKIYRDKFGVLSFGNYK